MPDLDDRDRSRRPRGPDEGNPHLVGNVHEIQKDPLPLFQVTGVVDEEIGEPGVTGVSHEFCEAIYSGMKRDETEFVLISGLPGCPFGLSKRGFASSDFGAKETFRRPAAFLAFLRQVEESAGGILSRDSRCSTTLFGDQSGLGGLLDELLSPHQGGQPGWNAVEGRLPLQSGTLLFSPFNAFPVRPDLIGVFHPDAPEDMRVSADEFFDDSPADVIEVEGAALPGELGVEDNLEEKITEFFREFGVIPRLNGVQEFVNLLHGVPSKGSMVLVAVPRTALRRSKGGHDFDQLSNGGEAPGGRGYHGGMSTEFRGLPGYSGGSPRS